MIQDSVCLEPPRLAQPPHVGVHSPKRDGRSLITSMTGLNDSFDFDADICDLSIGCEVEVEATE